RGQRAAPGALAAERTGHLFRWLIDRLKAYQATPLVRRRIQHSLQAARASPRGRRFDTNRCLIVRLLPRPAGGKQSEMSPDSTRVERFAVESIAATARGFRHWESAQEVRRGCPDSRYRPTASVAGASPRRWEQAPRMLAAFDTPMFPAAGVSRVAEIYHPWD